MSISEEHGHGCEDRLSYAPNTSRTSRIPTSIHHYLEDDRRRFPQVDQTDRLGLAITWPDTDFPFYNALFLTEELMDAQVLQEKVQQAAAYLRARRNSGLFVVCLDNVSGAAKKSLPTILAAAKFVQAIPMTGIAGDILPVEAPGHPALRFERIFNDRTI